MFEHTVNYTDKLFISTTIQSISCLFMCAKDCPCIRSREQHREDGQAVRVVCKNERTGCAVRGLPVHSLQCGMRVRS